MLTLPRLARAVALLALAVTLLAQDADAQRSDTIPTYTVVFGGFDFLHATDVLVGRTPLTNRTPLDRVDRLRLTGLSFPSGGPKGGDCSFEEPTCNGRIIHTDPTATPTTVCYDLFDVVITPSLSDASSGILKEQTTFEFNAIQRAGMCSQDE